jgi:mevalonate kinase
MLNGIYEDREKLFTDTLNRNQNLLKKLGVIPEKTIKLTNALKDFGIAKTIGLGGLAGASNFTLFYCNKKPQSLQKYLKDRGIIYFKFKQSNSGFNREG